MRLIAQGLSNQEIADQIAVSEPTVRAHVSRILGKLHLASRTQAALYAVREGLTEGTGAGRGVEVSAHEIPPVQTVCPVARLHLLRT